MTGGTAGDTAGAKLDALGVGLTRMVMPRSRNVFITRVMGAGMGLVCGVGERALFTFGDTLLMISTVVGSGSVEVGFASVVESLDEAGVGAQGATSPFGKVTAALGGA
jgi:hypothetical protein